MTHDELVRFAAEKLGVELLDTHFISGFDLSSPDLFFKGLEAFNTVEGRWLKIQMSTVEMGINKAHSDEHGISIFKDDIAAWDIPLTFWQCWYELEGAHD